MMPSGVVVQNDLKFTVDSSTSAQVVDLQRGNASIGMDNETGQWRGLSLGPAALGSSWLCCWLRGWLGDDESEVVEQRAGRGEVHCVRVAAEESRQRGLAEASGLGNGVDRWNGGEFGAQ
jgi:hypothetical protein